MKVSGLLVHLLAVIFLSACSFGVPVQGPGQAGSGSRYSSPDSYVVKGQRYDVLKSSAGFVERGIASWYGPDFHGKRTSNGEIYNMHSMTAAHKTLPFPTWVEVTNLSNGRKARVRINDRGPFAPGRVIDLSFAAAKKLDMIGPGTARVDIVALGTDGSGARSTVRAIPLPAKPAGAADIYIQVGAFSSRVNAIKLRNALLQQDEQAVEIFPVTASGRTYYRVRQGPLLSVQAAEIAQKRLLQKGIRGSRIVIGDN